METRRLLPVLYKFSWMLVIVEWAVFRDIICREDIDVAGGLSSYVPILQVRSTLNGSFCRITGPSSREMGASSMLYVATLANNVLIGWPHRRG